MCWSTISFLVSKKLLVILLLNLDNVKFIILADKELVYSNFYANLCCGIGLCGGEANYRFDYDYNPNTDNPIFGSGPEGVYGLPPDANTNRDGSPVNIRLDDYNIYNGFLFGSLINFDPPGHGEAPNIDAIVNAASPGAEEKLIFPHFQTRMDIIVSQQ